MTASKLQGPAGVPVGEVKFNELEHKQPPVKYETTIRVLFKDGKDITLRDVVNWGVADSFDGASALMITTRTELQAQFVEGRQAVKEVRYFTTLSEVRCYSVAEVK